MSEKQPTKAEQEAVNEFHAGRAERAQAEIDRQSQLIDPMTHPSSGDPPYGVTPEGDRMGTAPEPEKPKAEHKPPVVKKDELKAAEKPAPKKDDPPYSSRPQMPWEHPKP
jgi:hypothetical protein